VGRSAVAAIEDGGRCRDAGSRWCPTVAHDTHEHMADDLGAAAWIS
jgi:hypothetical protein